MRKRSIRAASVFMLLVTLLNVLTLFPSFTQAANTQTYTLNFGQAPINGHIYLPQSQITNVPVNVANGTNQIVSWEVNINGTVKSNYGTLSGTTITLPTIDGQSTRLYSKSNSNPGFKITRSVDGLKWLIAGSDPDTGQYASYTFNGPVGTSGISEYPGLIPSDAPAWFRESTSGRAMTYSKDVPPPDQFYFNSSYTGTTISPSAATNINITGATPSMSGVHVLAFGQGNPGKGMVKVSKQLDDQYNIQNVDWWEEPFTGSQGYNQLRNYYYNVDAAWEATTYQYDVTITVTYNAAPTPTPTPPPSPTITGDFDIVPSTINYRDNFTLHPKNFVLTNGCAYQWHEYKFVNGTSEDYSKLITSQTQDTTYSYSTYPANITAGSIQVYIKVAGDCGDSGWIGPKTLTVNSPANNHPPVFQAGFFKSNDYNSWKPEYQAVYGSTLNLRIITTDPFADPKEPYDPDGDSYQFTWDFAGSSDPWIQKIGTDNGGFNHQDTYSFIHADALGTHSVKVTMTDIFGAATTHTVSITIVPPNPVAIIKGPDSVVEGRPLPSPFDGSNSYSPTNAKITQYLWTNKKDVYSTPGTETITLDVVDENNLKSLAPATHTLTVKPDLPPIAELSYGMIGIRNNKITFQDTSYSPDGDTIVEHTVSLVCDKNNNGSYADDTQTPMTPDSNGFFTYTPTQVGNCKVHIHVKEDWGKSADKDFPFSIVNLQPTVLASITSQNPLPPDMITTAYVMSDLPTDKTKFKVEDFYNSSLPASRLIYDSSEKALGAPDKKIGTSYATDNSPAKNFLFPNQSVSLSIDPTKTNSMQITWWGLSSGLSVSKAQRFNHDVWYYYRDGAACSDGYCVNSEYSMAFYNEKTGVKHELRDTNSQLGWKYQINRQTGMLWLRSYRDMWSCGYHPDYGYNCTGTTITDYQYKISADGTPTLMTTEYRSWPQANGQPGTFNNRQMDINLVPAPSWWVPETSHEIIESSPPPWNIDINGNKIYDASAINPIRDKQGNFYAFACSGTYSPTYSEASSCYLEKVSPSGTVLWTNTTNQFVPYRSWPYYNQFPNVKIGLVTKDNSKIFLSDGIYDNNTGEFLGSIPYISGYNYCEKNAASADLPCGFDNAFLGNNFYDDKIAYKLSTANGIHFVIYDIRNSKVINDTVISNSAQSIYEYITPTSNGMALSAQGKYYSNWTPSYTYGSIITMTGYDMETGAQVFQTSYDMKSASTNYNGEIPLKLTDDNKGYLTSYGSCGDLCTYYESVPFTLSGTNTRGDSDSYGDIIDKTASISDGSLNLSIKFTKDTFGQSVGAGLIFREQDNKNYYKALATTSGIILSKYVNGVRTEIQRQTYPLSLNAYHTLKVKLNGDHIIVYADGVPLIDVHDSQYSSGLYGLFADAPNVYVKGFATETTVNNGTTVQNMAIVDSAIDYSTLFSDPENDPAIPPLAKWTYTNMAPEKFLNAGDGKSDTAATNSYNNLVVNTPLPSIGKVGLFKIDFTEPDDPAPTGYKYPSTAFASFRQYADPYTNYVVVHRRPISSFTVSAAADGTIIWNDASYDPDRWLSPTSYSTEATGLNYQTTRGITERKYYYTTPSGTTVNQKLVTPQETGTYTVGMAVKDEYGAWSDWATQTINVTMIVVPDTPPVAGFNVTPTTTYRGVPVTITSTAHDAEDGAAANLQHEYYIRNITTGSSEALASTNRGTWTKTFSSLGVFEIRQVVTDSKGLSAQITKQVTIQNRPPTANFTWSPNPVWEGDALTLTNQSTDPDGDALSYVWEITAPDASRTLYHTQHAVLSAVRPGTYQVKLTASDGQASSTAIRNIHALELTIQSAVMHTPEWLRHHQEKGHRVAQPPLDFYSGEIFKVKAESSPAPVRSVTAWLDTEGLDGNRLQVSTALEPSAGLPTRYAGELYDERFMSVTEGLPAGRVPIHFRIEYANGVIKEETIDVNIIGNVRKAVGVHRRQ
ncbi:PKD domain-containing protein [Ferviditalea candida]|uniref:PKD/Chitinase domain-containing protein n=1 Tax=Ferviditalea candida TaxID=3108399 RepID=A0ABU5ZGW3_9BACL|nr:hypothetical protein [Paenibacillaceae bacterium T2]